MWYDIIFKLSSIVIWLIKQFLRRVHITLIILIIDFHIIHIVKLQLHRFRPGNNGRFLPLLVASVIYSNLWSHSATRSFIYVFISERLHYWIIMLSKRWRDISWSVVVSFAVLGLRWACDAAVIVSTFEIWPLNYSTSCILNRSDPWLFIGEIAVWFDHLGILRIREINIKVRLTNMVDLFWIHFSIDIFRLLILLRWSFLLDLFAISRLGPLLCRWLINRIVDNLLVIL